MKTKLTASITCGATQSTKPSIFSQCGFYLWNLSVLFHFKSNKQSEIYYRNDLFHIGWFIHRKIFLLGGKAKEEQSLITKEKTELMQQHLRRSHKMALTWQTWKTWL